MFTKYLVVADDSSLFLEGFDILEEAKKFVEDILDGAFDEGDSTKYAIYKLDTQAKISVTWR